MLEQLGLFGFDRIERAILAGLVLGEPILFVGGPGSAKTRAVEQIARAFGFEAAILDSSKAAFEDLAGLPDPRGIAAGKVEFLPTPASIWGKSVICWDELSRAAYGVASKILETIRSRRFLGVSLEPQLQLVFAAMNPPNSTGSRELDPALAGRFTPIIRVPEFSELKAEARRAIIRNVTGDDAQGLGREAKGTITSDLPEFVRRTRERYRRCVDGRPTLVDAVVSYVDVLVGTLVSRGVPLDGRRAGELYRLALACLCVTEEKTGRELALSEKAVADALLDAVQNGLPFPATGRVVEPAIVRAAHETGLAAARGLRWARVLQLPADPVDAVDALVSSKGVPEEEARAAVSKILGRADEGDADRRAMARVAVALLARKVATGSHRVGADDAYRILDHWRQLVASPRGHPAETLEALREAQADDPARLASPRAVASLRIALGSNEGRPHRSAPYMHRREVDPREVARIAKTVESLLDEIGGGA
jgi:MoxR-like ATPase